MNPARRKLLLGLRRRVVAWRRFDVVGVEGTKITYKCRTCGHNVTDDLPSEFGAKFLAKYQDTGVSGQCPTCTENDRDERYPLK